jgi:hypothetical protein
MIQPRIPMTMTETMMMAAITGHLQYDFAIHLSQLEKVEGTDSISLAVLRTQYIAILAGLMMRVLYRVF